MSRRAKYTFASSIVAAGVIIPWVHHMQEAQRETIRQGPVKDVQRRQQRRLTLEQKERMDEYDEQKKLRETLSKTQAVQSEESVKNQ